LSLSVIQLFLVFFNAAAAAAFALVLPSKQVKQATFKEATKFK
jgi:hypothetical protein